MKNKVEEIISLAERKTISVLCSGIIGLPTLLIFIVFDFNPSNTQYLKDMRLL